MGGSGFPEKVLAAVRSVAGEHGAVLHEPTFGGNEERNLHACLRSTFVASGGRYVDEFEAELGAVTGSAHVIAVASGTAALQVALRLVGVAVGDEVLVPALTFVATANAVSFLGAVPHFVDCEATTFGLDPSALREHLEANAEMRGGRCINRSTGRVIRAVIPVHVFGHPAPLEGLLRVADEHGIAVVEDAAESLGSTRKSVHTGTIGEVGALSFNGNKIVTTGGGGAVLTNAPELAARARHLAHTAKVDHPWEYVHDEVGYNYRLPEINAALGCAQLERLPELLERKRSLLARYTHAFEDIDGLELVSEPPGCSSNYWLHTIKIAEPVAVHRDSILELCNASGYHLRPPWRPLHRLEPYGGCPRAGLPIAEHLYRTLINLPSSAHLA